MFDTLTIAALTDELSRRLIDGRVQKVIQLDAATIGIEIYADHQRHMLIASADNRNPLAYLASSRVTADPDRVSPLLLLLRKYVRGGIIVAVQQPPLERIIRLSIAKRFWPDKNDDADEEEDDPSDADVVYTDLVIEIMGRRSNIMLVTESGKMLDAMRRVSSEMSRVRPILPGKPYVPPPPQAKQDPTTLSVEQLQEWSRQAPDDQSLQALLVGKLAGFSPQMAREAVFRSFGDIDINMSALNTPEAGERLRQEIATMLAPLANGEWEPAVYVVDDVPVAFAPIRLRHQAEIAEERPVESISVAIEIAGLSPLHEPPVRHAQRRVKLVGEIEEARARAAARYRSLTDEQERARQADRWREMGELIYAYLYLIEPGQTQLDVDGELISLDPDKSPSENAQAYFDRYRRAQSATQNLPGLTEDARLRLSYLEELQTLASQAEGIDQIEQLRREWSDWQREQQSGAQGQPDRKKPKKTAPAKRPQPLRTARGDLIYVGHNGRQNEMVTFEIATADDIWLHARGLPGAHVIVRWAGDEDAEILSQAASIAAWFSGGRESTSVEVDATARRFVRKIRGAGPGMVTYRNEQTLNVRPLSPEQLGLSEP